MQTLIWLAAVAALAGAEEAPRTPAQFEITFETRVESSHKQLKARFDALKAPAERFQISSSAVRGGEWVPISDTARSALTQDLFQTENVLEKWKSGNFILGRCSGSMTMKVRSPSHEAQWKVCPIGTPPDRLSQRILAWYDYLDETLSRELVAQKQRREAAEKKPRKGSR